MPPSFAWIDHRLRSSGFVRQMTPDELGLYVFLVLAADRQGLSCWRLDRIERELLCLDVASLREAREGLRRLKLVAYRPWSPQALDGSYQVLPVPTHVPQPRDAGPTAIGALLSDLDTLRS
jgi:hypothetical protein